MNNNYCDNFTNAQDFVAEDIDITMAAGGQAPDASSSPTGPTNVIENFKNAKKSTYRNLKLGQTNRLHLATPDAYDAGQQASAANASGSTIRNLENSSHCVVENCDMSQTNETYIGPQYRNKDMRTFMFQDRATNNETTINGTAYITGSPVSRALMSVPGERSQGRTARGRSRTSSSDADDIAEAQALLNSLHNNNLARAPARSGYPTEPTCPSQPLPSHSPAPATPQFNGVSSAPTRGHQVPPSPHPAQPSPQPQPQPAAPVLQTPVAHGAESPTYVLNLVRTLYQKSPDKAVNFLNKKPANLGVILSLVVGCEALKDLFEVDPADALEVINQDPVTILGPLLSEFANFPVC